MTMPRSVARLILMSAVLSLALMLAACAPRIYGVPEEHWEQMSESERQEAMRAWESVQKEREQTRREQQEIEARERAERQARIDRIHRGEEGHFGDLIRVSLERGRMRIGGSDRRYAPVSFTLADGETRTVEIHSERRSREMKVSYREGLLLLDLPTHGRNEYGAARLPWRSGWRRGETRRVDSDGPLELRNVRVHVEAVPLPGHGARRF